MRNAYLLSSDSAMYAEFTRYLRKLTHKLDEVENSIKITTDDNTYFMLYNRHDGNFFEEHELPSEAMLQGYRFAFLVECRSEKLFCEIVGASPPSLGLLVCDSDARLYRPDELSPDSIGL